MGRNSTVDSLKEKIGELTKGLETERRSHVVRLNTLATECVEMQQEYIRALEQENADLRQKLTEACGGESHPPAHTLDSKWSR